MKTRKSKLALLSAVIALLGAILVAACSRQADTSPAALVPSPGPSGNAAASSANPSLALPAPASSSVPAISDSPGGPAKTVLAVPKNPVRSNSGGSVDFKITLVEISRELVFEVVMDTHSVNLDGFDLKTISVLRDEQKNEFAPVSWNAPLGGHHRSGTLTFAFPESLKQGQAITLVIRDVSGVPERVFEWAL